MELTKLMGKINEYGIYPYTCSVDNPDDHCITYAMNENYWEKLGEAEKELIVLVPESIRSVLNMKYRHKLKTIYVKNPAETFVLLHNYVNQYELPKPNLIDIYVRIHPSALIGADGMKYIKYGNGLLSMKHMGNVVIEKYAEIGPFSTVARATLDSTIIKEHARIGHGVYIGHNCRVGVRTIIVDGAIMGGSSEVGNDCWLGLNSTIRNGIKICDNVMIAMGAVITKDINKPGLYVGAPARRIGDWDGSW